MKFNTKRAILLLSGALVLIKDGLCEDIMDKAVNSLDPSIKPWAGMLVTLIRAAYISVSVAVYSTMQLHTTCRKSRDTRHKPAKLKLCS